VKLPCCTGGYSQEKRVSGTRRGIPYEILQEEDKPRERTEGTLKALAEQRSLILLGKKEQKGGDIDNPTLVAETVRSLSKKQGTWTESKERRK